MRMICFGADRDQHQSLALTIQAWPWRQTVLHAVRHAAFLLRMSVSHSKNFAPSNVSLEVPVRVTVPNSNQRSHAWLSRSPYTLVTGVSFELRNGMWDRPSALARKTSAKLDLQLCAACPSELKQCKGIKTTLLCV